MNWSGHCADIVPDARRFRPRSGETSMNLRPFAAACLASVLLAACSTVPQTLQGEFNQITPREAAELDSTVDLVRWGGRIVQVEPKENRTCVDVISTRINANGSPYWATDDPGGRTLYRSASHTSDNHRVREE